MICLQFDPAQIIGLERGLELVSQTRGFTLGDGVRVEVGRCEKGLEVTGNEGGYRIRYGEKVCFFRAVALLVGIFWFVWLNRFRDFFALAREEKSALNDDILLKCKVKLLKCASFTPCGAVCSVTELASAYRQRCCSG